MAVLLASALIHIGLYVPANAQTDPEESPGILLGAHIPPVDPSFGPNRLYYWQEIKIFNQLVGRQHPIIMYYSDLTSGLNGYLFDQLKDQLDPSPVPYVQMDPVPNIGLWDIANGLYDAQLKASAQGVKDFGKPIIIGFAHEFNETYSPFFGDPAAYIAAWRHVHRIFTREGATNVQWLWPPNYKSDRPDAPLTDHNLYYPGDDYVDWIGVYGFNWGNDFTKGPGWVEFDYLFDEFLRNTACRYDKPLMVGPTASVEGPGSKAQWIANLYRGVKNYPNIRAVVWFNDFAYNNPGEADFRVTVSSQYGAVPGPLAWYTNSYRNAISSPAYITTAPPYQELKPSSRVCFTVDVSPRAVLLEWDGEATAKVTVKQAPIFDTAVNISVTGGPTGIRYVAEPATVSPDASGAVIDVQAPEGTPTGTYTLTITGQAGGLTQSETLSVVIVEEAHRTYLPQVFR
jgi:hypothetical protein